MSPEKKADRRLTRKEAKARTRRKLIDGLLELSRTEGIASLSTTRIARRAGVSQSVFYDHFSDMNDALTVAAEEAGARIREAMARRRATIEMGDPTGGVRATFEAGIEGLLAEPMLAELLLRYRREPDSPLGETIRNILAEARRELIADMDELGLRDHLPHMEVHAGTCMAMAIAVVEGLLDGRYPDREACLEVITRITAASLAPG